MVSHMISCHVIMATPTLAYDEYEASKYSPKLLKAVDIKDEVDKNSNNFFKF